MGAKAYLLIALATLLSGCANFDRFLPAGLFKQEDLAGDQPINPEIAKVISERRETQRAVYPILAEQPTKVPEGISKGDREGMQDSLEAAAEELSRSIDEERAQAAAERAGDLQSRVDEIAEATAADKQAAERERRNAPKPVE